MQLVSVQFTGAATASVIGKVHHEQADLVLIINPPKEPSWISVLLNAASTWLWEHSDLILLLLGEVLLAAVIVAVFDWREHRQAQRADAETMRRIGAMEFNHRREED